MTKIDFENIYKICPICSSNIEEGGWGSYRCIKNPVHFAYSVYNNNIDSYHIILNNYNLFYKQNREEITVVYKYKDLRKNDKWNFKFEENIWLLNKDKLMDKFEKLKLLI